MIRHAAHKHANRVRSFQWGLVLALNVVQAVIANTPPTEHKIHNIVLYPDKHSWCKTQEIKQIVTYPKCSNVEIDNNVCVGACFSYSIPLTSPSSPGEVITPYCDSCQPAHYTWKEVKLTCESDSDEEADGVVEMTKKVQVITNCTCTSCEKSWNERQESHKHSEDSDADVPELMSLMMQKTQQDEADEESREANQLVTEIAPPQGSEDLENMIDVDEEKEKEVAAEVEEKEEPKIEIVHVNHHGSHLVQGPHHSLVIMPDEIPQHHQDSQVPHHKHHKQNDDEQVPSLLENQFKEHQHEEYPDQLAVESRKDFSEGVSEVLSVPELIYQGNEKISVTSQEEAIPVRVEETVKTHPEGGHRHHPEGGHPHHHEHHEVEILRSEEVGEIAGHKAVKIVDVAHHHLTPAVDGTQISYEVKRKE